jgi:hypothetical protein
MRGRCFRNTCQAFPRRKSDPHRSYGSRVVHAGGSFGSPCPPFSQSRGSVSQSAISHPRRFGMRYGPRPGPRHLSLIGIVGRSARLNQKNSNMSAHTESNHRRILTIDETAELLNVSTTLLQRSALADFGPTVYIVDNGFRYGRDEVIEWRDKSWKRDQFTQAG